MSRNLLEKYNEKRDFGITAEPEGKAGKRAISNLRFVIQLHEATRTHYDLPRMFLMKKSTLICRLEFIVNF